MENKLEHRKRIKPTHYEKDIHIRIKEEHLEKVKQIAKEKNVTTSLMIREIIELYLGE